MDTFHTLGARPWRDAAATELRAAGEQPGPRRTVPSALDVLSGQELQCATAVARGLSNREVATTLFISPKTVEYHLGKAYAKLGIRSRTQLTRMVLDGPREDAGGR